MPAWTFLSVEGPGAVCGPVLVGEEVLFGYMLHSVSWSERLCTGLCFTIRLYGSVPRLERCQTIRSNAVYCATVGMMPNNNAKRCCILAPYCHSGPFEHERPLGH
jgi:hypothetical protein